jgi:hypothetical protein
VAATTTGQSEHLRGARVGQLQLGTVAPAWTAPTRHRGSRVDSSTSGPVVRASDSFISRRGAPASDSSGSGPVAPVSDSFSSGPVVRAWAAPARPEAAPPRSAPARPGGARVGQLQLGTVARAWQLQLGPVEHSRSLAARKPGKRAR